MPTAVVVLTPITEAREVEARQTNEGRDPRLRWQGQIDKALAAYLGGATADDPVASPVLADWRGYDVPTLITTGGIDLLHSDCIRLEEQMREHGVPVTLDSAPGLWHAYQARPELPESRESVIRIARFIAAARAK